MQLTTFSSMTPDEFFRVNQDNLPVEIQNFFESYAQQIKELEVKVEQLERSEELAWEQVSFARDLIEQLDAFVENELSKPKRKMYYCIRENTYFEV